MLPNGMRTLTAGLLQFETSGELGQDPGLIGITNISADNDEGRLPQANAGGD